MIEHQPAIATRLRHGIALCAIGLMAVMAFVPGDALAQSSRRMGTFDSATPPAPAPPPPSGAAMRNTRRLPDLVARVQSVQPYRDMDYIGVERFDSRTGTYILRFIDGRRVVVVHVNGRTGQVLNRER